MTTQIQPLTPAQFKRTYAQRMHAIQRANETRFGRARVKRELKADVRKIHELLDDPPESAETWKIEHALLTLPKFGSWKVERVFKLADWRGVHINGRRSLGALTARQRNALHEILEDLGVRR